MTTQTCVWQKSAEAWMTLALCVISYSLYYTKHCFVFTAPPDQNTVKILMIVIAVIVTIAATIMTSLCVYCTLW